MCCVKQNGYIVLYMETKPNRACQRVLLWPKLSQPCYKETLRHEWLLVLLGRACYGTSHDTFATVCPDGMKDFTITMKEWFPTLKH